jgi:hypothetical protein
VGSRQCGWPHARECSEGRKEACPGVPSGGKGWGLQGLQVQAFHVSTAKRVLLQGSFYQAACKSIDAERRVLTCTFDKCQARWGCHGNLAPTFIGHVRCRAMLLPNAWNMHLAGTWDGVSAFGIWRAWC